MNKSISQLELEGPGVLEPGAADQRRAWLDSVRSAGRLARTRVGLMIWFLLILVALFGPALAPQSPTEFVGAPNSSPSEEAFFGTDNLGRDVLSRFLNGGRSVIMLSFAAAVTGVGLGSGIGIVAAYSRGILDDVLMRFADVIMAFPQIIFVLILLAGFGPKIWLLVLAVGFTHAPRTARVVRGAALDVVERDFVRAAESIGEKRWRLLLFEVMPNVASPMLIEFGLRLTYSIALVAGLSFLGFGLQPPSADWGLMINENRLAITQQPWASFLPVMAIALLTVGTNLIADGVARASMGIDRR